MQYEEWGKEGNDFILKKRDCIKNLEERGYYKKRGTSNKTFIHGIGLKYKEKDDIF